MDATSVASLAHLVAAWTAALYLVVGVALWQRRVDIDVRGPMRGFAVWWLGIGAVTFAALLPELGIRPTDWGLTAVRLFVYAVFIILYLAVTGLMHYLVYVYTGRRTLVRAASFACAAHFVLVVWLFEAQTPTIARVAGHPDLVFQDPLGPAHPLAIIFYLAILVPPILGTIAYSLLYFRLDERGLRYRVVMVSSGLLLWLVTNVFSALDRGFLGLPHQDPWVRLGAESLGFLAAAIVLVAFFPPRAVASRLGLTHEKDGVPPAH